VTNEIGFTDGPIPTLLSYPHPNSVHPAVSLTREESRKCLYLARNVKLVEVEAYWLSLLYPTRNMMVVMMVVLVQPWIER